MIADCPGCSDGADVQKPRRARETPVARPPPAILYALAPNCPICLVAYLSALRGRH